MRRMHTDQEIAALAGDNPIVKAAFDLATKTAETYKTAELVLNSSDFDALFDAKTTPYETSDPEEPDVINALYNADIIIIYSAGASGTAKEDPHFFRKMRESNYEEKAYFECFEMDTGKLYHYEMSISRPEEGGEITITPLKTFEPLLSDIVDAEGKKRFQQLTIDFSTSYGNVFKGIAALNGKILTIAGNIGLENLTASIPNSTSFATIPIPSWLGEKIYEWGGGNQFVRHFQAVADPGYNGPKLIALYKQSNTELRIRNIGGAPITQQNAASMSFEISLVIE